MLNRQTGAFALAKPRPLMFFWLLGGLWSLLATVSPLPAAEASARIESVHVGFRGLVEVGRWTPVTINVTGTPGTEVTPRVTAADVDGRPVRHTGSPMVLDARVSSVSLVYQHGPLDSPVMIELMRGKDILATTIQHPDLEGLRLNTVSQLTDFVVCLGQPVLGFERAAEIANEIRATRPDRVAPLVVQQYAVEQFGELPPDPRGWEAVDVCVISPECEVTDRLGDQLKAWVRQGGRLVLVGGAEVPSAAASGLKSWLPVKREGAMTLRDMTSLNTPIPGSATLRLRDASLSATHWSVESGAVLAHSLDGPLVVRTGESLGTVTAIAVNINELPFVRHSNDQQRLVWESLPDLCRWLAGLPLIPKFEDGSQRLQSDLNPTGVTDLQTQLVNTVDSFPEIVRPSYWVVLGSALLFMLIVGPLDYVLVHRVLMRPHWTWVSLPVWIGLGGAVGLSAASRAGGEHELIRQLDLVTWDASQQSVQLDSWLSIYSPQHHRYEVACEPVRANPTAAANTQLRWAGRPEAGFRGLYRSTGIEGGAIVEQSASGNSVRELPVRTGGSAVIEAKSNWEQSLPLTFDLTDAGNGHLRGTFSHQCEGELVDWVLGYGSFAYLPTRNQAGVEKPLMAGETIRVDQIPSRILSDHLVRMGTRSVMRSDHKSSDYFLSRESYDPLGRDLFTVIRTASFHQLAGGMAYTGLTNSTLHTEDLSRLIDAKRAVVFGRWRNSAYGDAMIPVEVAEGVVEPLAALYTVDGKPVSPRYRECFVRWVLPVKQPSEVPAIP